MKLFEIAALWIATAAGVAGHEIAFDHVHGSTKGAVTLEMVTEREGPVKTVPIVSVGVPVSGQGFWTFVAMKELMPAPEETKPFLKGAHGTLAVDRERDIVYWGLEKVGWVAFSNKLTASWVVKGDPIFARGNLHGADLLPRAGKLPLVVATDNLEGEVYLSDTRFEHAEKLDWPQKGPYKTKSEYKPTDAAFVDEGNIFITDGYGKQWLMHATTDPLRFTGPFIGGPDLSRTPHGITYRRERNALLLAARPEGVIAEYDFATQKWGEPLGLPAGSTVCDVDLWGDYALAPCLDGPNKSPGPIYIINMKKRAIVSTLRLKEELGYTDAQHVHDAAWYVRGEEVYILFTNWNPGGVGVVKLVRKS